jgi:hypothetical protein
MAYGWINQAPIRKVDQSEVEGIAKTLRGQIKDWGEGSQTWDTARRYDINKQGALKLLRTIIKVSGGSDFNYVYEYGGMVLGLLLGIAMPDYLSVHYLLVHPGTEGGGAILLEFAVNLSYSEHTGGKVMLASLNQNSSDFYLRMGFERAEPADTDGGGAMFLDPATRLDLWVQHASGEWALKAYVGKKFAGATD